MEGSTILDLALDQVPELTMIPEGEALLRCVKAEVKMKKDGTGRYLNLQLEDAKLGDSTDDVYAMLALPGEGDAPKAAIKKKQRLIEAMQAFGVPISASLNPESFVGCEAWANIAHQEDETYGNKANVQRFLVGQSA